VGSTFLSLHFHLVFATKHRRPLIAPDWRPLSKSSYLVAAVVIALFAGLPAAAQPVTILHSFGSGSTDGKVPFASLTASGSTLYGMTSSGGAAGHGTVFAVDLDGSNYVLVHSFAGGTTDGATPTGSLVLSGTTLYGTTQFGGSLGSYGTVFKGNTNGTGFSVMHAFAAGASDGEGPLGTLALSGSTLYGMTTQGGTANLGTAFSINTDNTGFGVIHSFTGPPGDGNLPSYSALAVSGSTLYGMTIGGGAADQGAVFKMGLDGSNFSLLHSFTPATGDGGSPAGSLTLLGSTLYGTTRQGGSGGAGTVFEINTDGSNYNVLHNFTGQAGGDGAHPDGALLTLIAGRLYGTTDGGGTANLGTIFGMNLDGTAYNVMHSFLGGTADGAGPQGDLTLVGNTLYGMTGSGGANNFGTVFSIPIPVPEPSTLVLVTAAAAGLAYLARRRAKK
jgi:uncharacterized repeat protein (TIGR03803 family)